MSGERFIATQWRRLVTGWGLGCLLAIAAHLLWRDRVFVPTLRKKWATVPAQSMFDGVFAYKTELLALGVVVAVAAVIPAVGILVRYLRAWWAGMVSLTMLFSAFVTLMTLWNMPLTARRSVQWVSLLTAVIALELWRSRKATAPKRSGRPTPPLRIPSQNRSPSVEDRWQPSNNDDPIVEWSQDIVGRASVVELLVEHILVRRTPIVALHGGLGDGKSSVLRLLRRSLERHAITVSFSTWLPGSEETLAVELFKNIVAECRRRFYIPRLKKQAIAYARTISGSVPYWAGLRDILLTRSQQQEIENLRNTLARVPLPIVVLLDEVDRMQRDEINVLLKILRGASSIPNVSFVCAFSDEELKKQLSPDSTLSFSYLEKFFPVSVNLSSPDPAMIGRLLQARIRTAALNGQWFLGTDEKTFVELVERMWQESLSRICTNLRKTSLLLNDLSASGRIIGGEINTVDLIGIETIRRFAPTIYQFVRKNPAFLTYGGDSWTKRKYVSDKLREKEASEFFSVLEGQLAQSSEPQAFRYLLSLLFPALDAAQGLSTHSIVRPTNEQLAGKEKRICDADYFTIYFRAAVPEDMFSEAELSATLERFNRATSDIACEQIFKEVLDGIPRQKAKRGDFLWKLGRSAQSRLDDDAAKWVAYAAASRAEDYTYDLMNVGEAARALNIVFESAQRFSQSSVVQEILSGAMKRCTDDTFALRLLEYTENRDRNKILTNFKFIDGANLRAAFLERMRRRYGEGVNPSVVDITTADPQAFRKWADNSTEDQKVEAEFWRGYIGSSRKGLAQAIDFLYPTGFSWSEDPSKWIAKFIPMEELRTLLETLKDKAEQLDEIESSAIARFQELLTGKWFNAASLGTLVESQETSTR